MQTDLFILAIYRKRNSKMLCCSFLHQPLRAEVVGTCEQQTTSQHSRPLDDLVAELLISDIPSQAPQTVSKFCRGTSKPQARQRHHLEPAETKNYRNDLLCSDFTESSWTLIESNYVPYPRSAHEHAAVHTLHLGGPLTWPMLLVHAGKHTHQYTHFSLLPRVLQSKESILQS